MSSSSPSDSVPTPPKDSWYPYSNGAHFNGNIAMILIFIFCALICALALNAVIRFFLHLSRQQLAQADEHHENNEDGKAVNQSSNQSPLHSLPTLVFSSGTKTKLAGGGEAAECAICLSEFVEGEGVRILPKCRHGFHVKCIQGWLSWHLSCPTCRATCLTTTKIDDEEQDHHYDVESPPQGAAVMLQRPGDVQSHPDRVI